jgi:ABC-type antimicrobial peptide transport system permease subunit
MPTALAVLGEVGQFDDINVAAPVVARPVSSLALFLILSAVLGLIAARWPARRAAKLDVLDAIATQ